MIKKPLLLFGFIFSLQLLHAQQFILLVKDFEFPDSVVVSDTGGPGTHTGSNQWIINNNYDGQGVYPNTTSEDSVYFNNGTIYLAPHSNYLHIHDSHSNPLISNENFNPNNASDNFAYTKYGFCTLGIDSVTMVFFYTAEGDTVNVPPTAYGQVYYSIDNGPWIQTGSQYYYKQSKWRYEQISDPAFANKVNVRFGFRWVNASGAIANTMSFGIDDIQVVANYNAANSPFTVTIDTVSATVCEQNYFSFGFHTSRVLCEGSYQFEISKSNGTGIFLHPIILGTYSLGYPYDSTYLRGILPASAVPDSCYRLRVIRMTPPVDTSVVSSCFIIHSCLDSITTRSALTTTDPLIACVQSVIDIKFNSYGVFNAGNNYVAQLSDSNGSFANPTVINSKPDNTTYDPQLVPSPGTVSGLIPRVPAGCGYKIRVVSTDPVTIGSEYGPFCLRHCDIQTDSTKDIKVCINEVTGIDTQICITTHVFDNTAQYNNGNRFQLQLLDKTSLGVVNTGGLFAVFDSVSNCYRLHIPNTTDLGLMGIGPDFYYARLIADNPNGGADTVGTLIRLIIGGPSANPPKVLVTAEYACNGGAGAGSVGGPYEHYVVSPIANGSTYEWYAAWSNHAGNFFSVGDPGADLYVNFTGAPAGPKESYVRELNNGCYGPLSDPGIITVITPPDGKITGKNRACIGDTVQLSVPFLAITYYSWASSGGNFLNISNNQVSMVFDSVGTVFISNTALNACSTFPFKDTLAIKVVSLVDVKVAQDVAVCKGEQVQLVASTGGISYSLPTDSNNAPGSNQGNMFNVTARQVLTIDSLDGNFSGTAPLQVYLYYKTGSFAGFEHNAGAWTLLNTVNIATPQPSGTSTPIPIPINLTMNPGDTLAFYIATASGNRIKFTNGAINHPGYVATDTILDFYQGPIVNYPFGSSLPNKIWSGQINYTTSYGLHYLWNTGATDTVLGITADSTRTYRVRISDKTGCGNSGQATVTIKSTPTLDAGNDVSVCYGSQVHVVVNTNGAVQWSPAIPDSGRTDFYFTPDSSITYTLQASGPAFDCKTTDQFSVTVSKPDLHADSGVICPDRPAILTLPLVVNGRYHWNTGDTTRELIAIRAGTYTGDYYYPGDSCLSRITFNVQSKENCEDIIQVPQAFTPNNDGQNDHFTVFGMNITDYEIKIFNRWGEMVYHSTDANEVNDLNRGWDGSHGGKLQNTGTFVYYIKAKDNYSHTTEQHGNLTLIR